MANLKAVLIAFFISINVSTPIFGKTGQQILSMKQRAAFIDQVLLERLKTLPAKLMRRAGIAMWVLVAREYNEDPVVKTMLPGTAFAAYN